MFKFLAIALLTSLFSIARAEPNIQSETHYYEVDGKTARAIRQDMNRKRSGDYDAYTKWWINWHFYWKESPAQCALTRAKVDAAIKFTLPKLASRSKANQEAKQRWQSYYQALIAHENGHRDLGIQAANVIEEALLTMDSAASCALLEKQANALAHGIIDEYIAKNKQYDLDTNHGINTGAVFP